MLAQMPVVEKRKSLACLLETDPVYNDQNQRRAKTMGASCKGLEETQTSHSEEERPQVAEPSLSTEDKPITKTSRAQVWSEIGPLEGIEKVIMILLAMWMPFQSAAEDESSMNMR